MAQWLKQHTHCQPIQNRTSLDAEAHGKGVCHKKDKSCTMEASWTQKPLRTPERDSLR